MRFGTIEMLHERSKSYTRDFTSSRTCRPTLDGTEIPVPDVDLLEQGRIRFQGLVSKELDKIMERVRRGDNVKMLTSLPVDISDTEDAHSCFTWQVFSALKSGIPEEVMTAVVRMKSMSGGSLIRKNNPMNEQARWESVHIKENQARPQEQDCSSLIG